MNHSAKDLFPDWYNQGIKKETTSEELKIRRKSIDELIAKDDYDLWLKILKTYLGIYKETSQEYQILWQEFKKHDDLFSVKDVHLLRLLLGCTIAEKIEQASTYISDLLSVGVLTAYSLSDEEILPELKNIAQNSWINECERNKDMDSFSELNSIKQNLNKISLPAVTGEPYPDSTSFKTFTDQLSTILNNVSKDITNVVASINNVVKNHNEIKSNFEALAEETNILWWLFNGYSNIANIPTKKLSPQLFAALMPIELYSLTTRLPGIGEIDNIILKAYENVEGNKIKTYKLEEIISSTSTVLVDLPKSLPDLSDQLISLCPFLSGIKCFIEFAGTEWKAIYSKKNNINVELEIPITQFTGQLYKELMLVRISTVCK